MFKRANRYAEHMENNEVYDDPVFYIKPNRYLENSESGKSTPYSVPLVNNTECLCGKDTCHNWKVDYQPGANNTKGDLQWSYRSPRMQLIDNSFTCGEFGNDSNYNPPSGIPSNGIGLINENIEHPEEYRSPYKDSRCMIGPKSNGQHFPDQGCLACKLAKSNRCNI